jgi:hypothetical protein
MAQGNAAPTPVWELLGETRVGFNVDRDVISVGQPDSFYSKRSYDRLRLTADRGEVQLLSLKVRYINGYEEVLPMDRVVRPGASAIVELPGRRSYIAQVEMTYKATGTSSIFDTWLKPRVRVFGLNSRVGLTSVDEGPLPNWQLLGGKTVSFRGDRDTIRLTRDEGWYSLRSFNKLHLVVSDGHVMLEEIRIVYFNGYAETIGIGRGLRAGTDLAIDLRGERSYLRQIEMRYRLQPGGAQRGQVKVYGEGRKL